LGKDADDNGCKDLERRILGPQPPEEVQEKAKRELSAFPSSRHSHRKRGAPFLREWLAASLVRAERGEQGHFPSRGILDEDHFGLKKAKERTSNSSPCAS
jgi:ATP-dependent Lon protease